MLPFQNVFEIRNNVSTPLPISVKLFLKSLPIAILDLPNSGWCDLAKFCNLANFWMGEICIVLNIQTMSKPGHTGQPTGHCNIVSIHTFGI